MIVRSIIIAAAAFGQDMATQLFFWDAFKAACRKAGVKRGKFMNPRVAEWLVGALLANCLPHKFYCALKSVNVCPISIQFARSLSGLPAGWTDPSPGAVSAAEFNQLFPQHNVVSSVIHRRSRCNVCMLCLEPLIAILL